jgi:hypothetical protein
MSKEAAAGIAAHFIRRLGSTIDPSENPNVTPLSYSPTALGFGRNGGFFEEKRRIFYSWLVPQD